jgi:hypothetical protein
MNRRCHFTGLVHQSRLLLTHTTGEIIMHIRIILSILTTALILSACGEKPPQSETVSDSNEASSTTATHDAITQTPAGETSLVEQAKELGQQTWDKTKEVTGETLSNVSEKSSEYYETTKDKAGEITETVKEKATELGSTISDKSGEYYDSAKAKTVEVYESSKEKSAEVIDSVTAK